MKISTYMFFEDQSRAALTFYQQVLGGELEAMMTFADVPESEGLDVPPAFRDRIMHGCLRLENHLLMASDSMPGQPYEGIRGCSITLSPDSVADGERLFAALAEGGRVEMPLAQTFWALRFGSLVDRFGVSWMINCETP
ncbi:VOC family protein [Stutzerimonas nosocomialis]|uniref:VOC family protein n=1 Tax=Stutzerimonas nosocomialis TaxID=1056496 RepID=UPI001109E4CF|nr:VOC family protein [Stutzerimonas nosocomialis]TLX55392.1 VOC family protein [Stutzerimonas nosocomialis]